MGNVTRYPDGTFCWVDLGTTDPAGARRLYGGLFSWEFVDTPSPDGAIYTLCRLDGRDVTAIHEHTPDEGSGWTSYVAVDDVEAATNRAVLLGARLTMEPFDIPGAARMAEIVDPAGAMVALWQEDGHIGAGVVNEFGTWTWTELVAQDLDAAIRFYGDLFGWTASDLPTPARRVSFSKDARLVAGGHVPTAGERPDPRWDVAFRVADVDASAARAEELGGRVVFGPMDIPIGRFAIVADPVGVPSTITRFEAEVRSVSSQQ